MRRRLFDCLVIGDVMLDIYAGQLGRRRTGESFNQGGTSYCDFARIEFGGAGNIATCLSLLGGKVSFIGKAGDDAWGRLYEADLTSKGITSRIFFEKRASTGISLVSLRPHGERSFYVFRGANDRLSRQDIEKSINLLRQSEFLYVSGYSLVADPQRSAILFAVRAAKKERVKVFFDPGAYNLVEANFELFSELLDTCDVFCPNIDEAKAITKKKRLEDAIFELQKRGKFVMLKCGSGGCLLVAGEQRIKVPGFKVKCLDTTGAGDAFSAASIYGLKNRLPLYSVGKLANWFAAQVTTGIGARNFPTRVRLLKFQKTLKPKISKSEQRNNDQISY